MKKEGQTHEILISFKIHKKAENLQDSYKKTEPHI